MIETEIEKDEYVHQQGLLSHDQLSKTKLVGQEGEELIGVPLVASLEEESF